MPLCTVDNRTINVDSDADCKNAGGVPFDTGVAGTEGQVRFGCFVRNVLTRALGEMILDIGASEAISADAVDAVDIPPASIRGGGYGKDELIPLTPDKKRDLAARAAWSVLTLADTYQTTVEFRSELLLTTARGRELNEHYETFLAEIFSVARRDNRLLLESATTWLSLYPFVKAMVEVARKPSISEGDAGPKLTPKAFKRCIELIQRFREGSETEAFRKLLDELGQELAEFEGLPAAQSVGKLRRAPARKPLASFLGEVGRLLKETSAHQFSVLKSRRTQNFCVRSPRS